MLETSHLARKYTSICNFSKYTFQCLGLLNFADVSIFLQKISLFCPKKYLYSKQQFESCVTDFLVLFAIFLRIMVTITENITFTDSVSGIRPPYCSKLAKNPEMTMMSQFSDMTSSSIFFTLFCFSCQIQLLFQDSCQYRNWFWNYDNFLL